MIQSFLLINKVNTAVQNWTFVTWPTVQYRVMLFNCCIFLTPSAWSCEPDLSAQLFVTWLASPANVDGVMASILCKYPLSSLECICCYEPERHVSKNMQMIVPPWNH